MNRHEQPKNPEWQTQADEPLFDISGLAADKMVFQMNPTAIPGIQTQLAKPDDKEHQVLNPHPASEVQVMNQIVLQFVQDRDGERHQRNGTPPDQLPLEIQDGNACHGSQAADKASHAQEILVNKPRVDRAQTLFLRVDDGPDTACPLNRVLFHQSTRRNTTRSVFSSTVIVRCCLVARVMSCPPSKLANLLLRCRAMPSWLRRRSA
ncbi:MAG: hypothetical protein AABP62_23955 [Planctomycetota bacterium]